MLRVKDLDRSVQFYTDVFGLVLLKRRDYPLGNFSIAFLACPNNGAGSAMIELTYNWDNRAYVHGDYVGHVAFVVDDIFGTCQAIEARGGEFFRKPGPMTVSPENKTLIAFMNDPDGHRIELMQRPSNLCPLDDKTPAN